MCTLLCLSASSWIARTISAFFTPVQVDPRTTRLSNMMFAGGLRARHSAVRGLQLIRRSQAESVLSTRPASRLHGGGPRGGHGTPHAGSERAEVPTMPAPRSHCEPWPVPLSQHVGPNQVHQTTDGASVTRVLLTLGSHWRCGTCPSRSARRGAAPKHSDRPPASPLLGLSPTDE